MARGNPHPADLWQKMLCCPTMLTYADHCTSTNLVRFIRFHKFISVVTGLPMVIPSQIGDKYDQSLALRYVIHSASQNPAFQYVSFFSGLAIDIWIYPLNMVIFHS